MRTVPTKQKHTITVTVQSHIYAIDFIVSNNTGKIIYSIDRVNHNIDLLTNKTLY